MRSTVYEWQRFFYHINLLYTSVAPLLLKTTFVPMFHLFTQVNSIFIIKVQVYRDCFVYLVPEYFDKRLIKNILFTLIVFTEYRKWCFQNTYKEIPWQKIKIYKYLFVLQILSAKFNEHFFVNMLGVWTASLLWNYMKIAVLYMFPSLSIEKCNPGMSVCSFDLLFKKLFLKGYPLV